MAISKVGRPAYPADERLTERIAIPCTPAWKLRLEAQARRAGAHSLGAYLRQRITAQLAAEMVLAEGGDGGDARRRLEV